MRKERRSGLDVAVRPILIVDDDVDVAAILADLLERRGFAVVTRCNGREALAYLRDAPPPALILSDVHMPIIDGYTLRWRLHESATLRGVPVVMMTDARIVDRERLGPTPVLAKPLTIERLVSAVREHARA